VDSDLLHGFYLDDRLIEPLKGLVVRDGLSIYLPPKAMEVLLSLASNPNQPITRDALFDQVWDGEGSQGALERAVSEIRNALGDAPNQSKFIQTLSGTGYRLAVQPVPTSRRAGGVMAAPAGSGNKEIGLFDNLKQRGVFEAAIAYLVFGWLIIQVADIVFDQLHLPAWAGTFVTALVIAGFPVVIVLSWFLEFRDGRAVLDQSGAVDLEYGKPWRWCAALFAGALAFGWQASPAHSDSELPQPALIFLVRHAEKAPDGNDPALTKAGRQRARDLATLLLAEGIEFVYSTDFARTRDTATPLAEQLGLQLTLYDWDQMDALAAELRTPGRRSLVVGHSDTTPELVGLLGGEPGTAIDESGEYDRLYVVRIELDGTVTTDLRRYGKPHSP
jgi:probable phosphoglycerate mutase